VRASIAIAIAIASFPVAVPAQQLGSLFHTPKERETLERLRRGDPVTQAAQAELARPDPVLTGYVKRSDGKSTVFLDKKPHAIRDERLQRRLDPRAVDRYEPIPWTPPPATPIQEGDSAKAAANPAPSKGKKSAAAAKTGEED
jgi:hypothetical protein